MENQNFEKDRLVFLDQYKNLLRNKMYAGALALAEERLKRLPMDADAYVAVGEALIAMDLMDEARELVCTVEKKISAMTLVLTRMGKLYTEKGYDKDARFCYQKFMVLSPSFPNRQEPVRQKTAVESMPAVKKTIDSRDNAPSADHVISTLSKWMTNINRIKAHAANDK